MTFVWNAFLDGMDSFFFFWMAFKIIIWTVCYSRVLTANCIGWNWITICRFVLLQHTNLRWTLQQFIHTFSGPSRPFTVSLELTSCSRNVKLAKLFRFLLIRFVCFLSIFFFFRNCAPYAVLVYIVYRFSDRVTLFVCSTHSLHSIRKIITLLLTGCAEPLTIVRMHMGHLCSTNWMGFRGVMCPQMNARVANLHKINEMKILHFSAVIFSFLNFFKIFLIQIKRIFAIFMFFFL